ncbi:hypothetical protein ACWT_5894 [Actinoplanes sp. SE50]|nr:hypothetical protein ACPL_6025 [Actinoplanes sp. SE50/110]ATO85309.1 hypothetical protein ACWT_5894 [Actinoplanes sp. SE50]SLM02719.1 hypothetical protein ACSP50_6001 [Actinoplanes sp. SE50/110]
MDEGNSRGHRDVRYFRGDEQLVTRLDWECLPDHSYRITTQSPDGEKVLVGRDLFDAVQRLRLELEPSGWRLAVQAALRGAYASGMLRDMYGGRKMYFCRMGRQVVRAEMIDILEPAQLDDVVTVEEQLEFLDRWRDSIRK